MEGGFIIDTIVIKDEDTNYNIVIGNTTTSNKIYSIEDLAIYPNPSNGLFRISSVYPLVDTELQLFDLTGKMLERYIIKNNNISIDWSNYRGSYLIKFITANGIDVRKLTFH